MACTPPFTRLGHEAGIVKLCSQKGANAIKVFISQAFGPYVDGLEWPDPQGEDGGEYSCACMCVCVINYSAPAVID